MSNPVLLQITDIIWDSSIIRENNLPKELEVQWNNGKWKNAEVSKFIRIQASITSSILNEK